MALLEVESIDTASKALYGRLKERKKLLAQAHKMPTFLIATNAVLEGLARRRPSEHHELLEVKGIGEQSQAWYGAVWLEVIAQFLASNGVQSESLLLQAVTTPNPNPLGRRVEIE